MNAPTEIRGYCPACGHGSLVVNPSPYVAVGVYCCWPDCPRPTAAHEILQDAQTDHVVTFTEDGFTLRHPVRERLDDELLRCSAHRYLVDLGTSGAVPGTYRMLPSDDTWRYERITHGNPG